jgi:hypothetical protein
VIRRGDHWRHAGGAGPDQPGDDSVVALERAAIPGHADPDHEPPLAFSDLQLSSFNALYGALGGIIAFLLWIYLSSCVCVFGVCFCAALAEVRAKSDGPLQPTGG